MKRLFISASLFALCLTASAQGTFISNAAYRTTMQQQFNERIKTVGKTFYNTSNLNLTADENQALEFLYAYMPLADITDYPTSFLPTTCACHSKPARRCPGARTCPNYSSATL